MKMKKKVFLMIVGLLFLVGLAVGLTMARNSKKAAEESSEVESVVYKNLIDVETGDIASIYVEKPGDSFTLLPGDVSISTGLTWYMKEHADWDLNYTYGSVVSIASKFSAYKLIEENVTDSARLEEFGLKDPVSIIITTMKDGTKYEVHVGNLSSDKSYAFCQLAGDDNVYACNGSNYTYAGYTSGNLRQPMIYHTINTKEELISIRVEQAGERTIDIYYDENGVGSGLSDTGGVNLNTHLTFREPYTNGALSVDIGLQRDYFGKLENPEIVKIIDPNCQDLAMYGLSEEAPVYRETITSRSGKAGSYVYNTTDYVFGYPYEGEYIYFREGDSNYVYGVDLKIMDTRRFKPFDFVNKLMFLELVTNVDHGTLTIDGKTTSFRAMRQEIDEENGITAENRLTVYYVNDVLVDEELFTNLFRTMIAVAPEYEILDEEPIMDNNDKVSFTLYLTDGTTATVTYNKISEFYYCTQVGDDIWFTTGTMYIDEIRKALADVMTAIGQ